MKWLMCRKIDWRKHARRRLFDKHEKARFTRFDWLAMMAVTLCYAVLAFTNLGSTQIPQTHYTFTGDDIVIEFEDTVTISSIRYLFSLSTGFLTLHHSLDTEGYDSEFDFKQKDEHGQDQVIKKQVEIDHVVQYSPYKNTMYNALYRWQFIDAAFTAKYVLIRVEKPGLSVLEMGFCDDAGNPVPIKSAKSTNPDAPRGNAPMNLFDEQQHVPARTSHMDEMYFDEIYHARTAYEHIHGIRPYETTHPPLGKILIGIGIQLFGMNPFGWRFIGALFGVLMLPLMYVFAKRIFKKTLYALIPTALFALDFMHFAQTRIATIDSYSVFFIMLMYFFMYLYTETNYNRQPLRKSLLPLALCGISFGLGAATKWLCIYAGFGLALLLFIQMVKRYREYAYAKQELGKDEKLSVQRRAFLADVNRDYLHKTFVTLLWCVLFFIIVPGIIYLLSYIPHTQVVEGAYTFEDILKNQTSMFHYHSDLTVVEPHAFRSEWYLWPFNVFPLYFFSGKGYPAGLMSRIFTMGNPLVWWGGICSVIALIVIRIRKGAFGRRVFFISIAALSQYVPWMLVSRETYIYHYFATVPFMILLMGVLAKYLIEHTKHGKKAVFIFLGACLLLFVVFYPITTGTVIPDWYWKMLSWAVPFR